MNPKAPFTLALLAAALAACVPLTGDPTGLPVSTATAPPAPASIAGFVWQDVCALTDGQPGPGCVAAEGGRYRADGLRGPAEAGLGGVVVSLGLSCPVANPVLAALTNPDGAFTFHDLPAGTYCLSVDPGRPENAALREGGWTAPSAALGGSPANVVVTVTAGEQKTGVAFGRDRQFGAGAATATPTPPAPVITPTATVACTERVAFVTDVTVPDDSYFQPGAPFIKTWRLQNAGSCPWTTAYALVLVGGNLPAAQTVIPLAAPVAPGATVDLSAAFKAPALAGVYRSEWQLRSAAGRLFGLGERADGAFWAQIIVGATPTPTLATPTLTRTPTATATTGISNWRGEYFRDRNLGGTPALVRDDVARDHAGLDFNWAGAAPAAGLPADTFAARWTRTVGFAQGTYRFRVVADDGVRVWIDDQLVIDDWVDGGANELSVEVALTQGAHTLKIEYYEALGDASLKFGWELVAAPRFPEWKGEYWLNRQFSGAPALARNDRAIDFDWGQSGAAVGLPADDFSVRWSRWVTFEPGLYRFSVNADDGVRVYVDGQLILDEWHENDGARTYTVDRALSGPRAVLVEYYDRSWRAMVKVRWELLPATATPTATATLTPTSTPTATATPTLAAPTATATATATATVAPAALSGRVWQDVCEATGQSWPPALPLPDGCVAAGPAAVRADGLRADAEAGLAQVVVTLAENECDTARSDAPVRERVTEADGSFAFTGLSAGRYCLSVDPLGPRNAPVLASGLWTTLILADPSGAARVTITLAAGENRSDVALGWDYLDRS